METFYFKDDQFLFEGVDENRLVARAIVLDDHYRVALHTVRRFDLGMPYEQTYFETPGGGVDEGETIETAAVRECEEELGYEIEVLCPLAIVDDFYNVIKRHNENHYFLARRKERVGVHFVSEGDTLIIDTRYYPIEEAIVLVEGQDDKFISGLVRQRELPILRLAAVEIAKMKAKEGRE